VLLVVLVVVLAGVLFWNLSSDPTPAATPKTANAGQAASSRRVQAPPDAPPDVALEALGAERPEPGDAERNPFRFKPNAPPPPPPGEQTGGGARAVNDNGPGPEVPVAPAGPPPIPLKFIGIVEEPAVHRRIAALSDGRFTFYGREGDIIDGRYRIVKIGIESIEMVHVDGRGPQTIRLSGS
jgi:hypothetical protein